MCRLKKDNDHVLRHAFNKNLARKVLIQIVTAKRWRFQRAVFVPSPHFHLKK